MWLVVGCLIITICQHSLEIGQVHLCILDGLLIIGEVLGGIDITLHPTGNAKIAVLETQWVGYPIVAVIVGMLFAKFVCLLVELLLQMLKLGLHCWQLDCCHMAIQSFQRCLVGSKRRCVC